MLFVRDTFWIPLCFVAPRPPLVAYSPIESRTGTRSATRNIAKFVV